MSEFKQGQEVRSVYYPDTGEIKTGEFGVERITVVMENGQMAGVPWFAIWKEGKIVQSTQRRTGGDARERGRVMELFSGEHFFGGCLLHFRKHADGRVTVWGVLNDAEEDMKEGGEFWFVTSLTISVNERRKEPEHLGGYRADQILCASNAELMLDEAEKIDAKA